MTDDDAWAAVDAAWDGGIRTFDTAPHYGLGMNQAAMLTRFVTETDIDVVLMAAATRCSTPPPPTRCCPSPSGSVIAGGVFNSGLLAAPARALPTTTVRPPSRSPRRPRNQSL
ncbi:MAG TPA: hypothetical protein VF223_10535 [Trebonia sp.]